MPDRTPFENVFAPEQQGLFGVMGSAFGVQDQGERQRNASADAMQELSKLMSTYPNEPQRAVTSFLGTPGGLEFFKTNPNAADEIGKFIKNVTPPPPQQSTLSPGQTGFNTTPQGQTTQYGSVPSLPQIATTSAGQQSSAVDAQGNAKPIASQPTTESQTFDSMSGVAELKPGSKELKDLATMHLQPPEVRVQHKNIEAARLMAERDPANASKYFGNLVGQTIKLEKVKDQLGRERILVLDIANGTVLTDIDPYKPQPFAPGNLPQPPNPDDPNGLQNAINNMGDYTGILGMAQRGLDSAGTTLHPQLRTQMQQRATATAGAIENARTQLQALGDSATGLGNAHLKGTTSSYMNLLPSANNLTSSPVQTWGNLKRLQDNIDQQIQIDQNFLAAGAYTNSQYDEASHRLEGWARVKHFLPSMDVINMKLENEAAGRGSGVNIKNFLGDTASFGTMTSNAIKNQGQPQSRQPNRTPSPAAPAPTGPMPSQPQMQEPGDSGGPLQLNTAPQAPAPTTQTGLPPDQQKLLSSIPSMGTEQLAPLVQQMQNTNNPQLKNALRQRLLQLEAAEASRPRDRRQQQRDNEMRAKSKGGLNQN